LRLLPLHERRQAERKLARHLAEDFASSLRIAPDIQDYTGHQDYQPPTLTTDDYYLARSTKWEPIYLPITSYGIPHLATNRTILPFGLPLRRFVYNPVPSVVPISMRSSLATNLSMPLSWKYLYFLEFSLYPLFFAIYQNY